MNRSIFALLLLISASIAALQLPQSARAQSLTITPRNTHILPPSTTDQHGKPFTLAGLSGLTHVGGGTFWAVMDNSDKLIEFNVSFDAVGNVTNAALARGLTLPDKLDFEGIAHTNAARNSVFLSDETGAGVREYNLATGARLQTLRIPAPFNQFRPSFGFESLTYRSDGREMWTANEEALTVDGSTATQTYGSPVRLLQFVLKGNVATAGAQYVYETDAMHGGVVDGGRSGLSDLVVLPNGKLLALERSLASSITPFRSRIYEIDFTGATDVSKLRTLIGQTFTPVKKRLLWSGIAGRGFGQNLEGLALGPKLSNGHWSLLGVVDNGDPLSNNTLVAFELSNATLPEPAAIGISFPLTRLWFTDLWRRK